MFAPPRPPHSQVCLPGVRDVMVVVFIRAPLPRHRGLAHEADHTTSLQIKGQGTPTLTLGQACFGESLSPPRRNSGYCRCAQAAGSTNRRIGGACHGDNGFPKQSPPGPPLRPDFERVL